MNKILRWFFLAMSYLNIAACASSQIHIFRAGVTDSDVAHVRAILEEAGYRVTLNTLPIPDNIVGPTLIYSPQHSRVQDVEHLGDMLMDMGYSLHFATTGLGNHFYTAGNLGLYLTASSPSYAEDSLVDRTYNGQCEENDAYLHFFRGRFRLEMIDWDEDSNKELVTEKSGLWERDSNTVTLYLQDQHVDLFLTPLQYETQYSKIRGLRLVNDSTALRGCSFEYRETAPL